MPRVAVQKALKCGEQGHEGRGAMGSADGFDGARQASRKLQFMPCPAACPYFRPGSVRSQRQLTQAIKPGLPIIHLRSKGRRGWPSVLPLGKLAMLDGKLRQSGGVPISLLA